MLFKNYFNYLVLLPLLCILGQNLTAAMVEAQCGEQNLQVKILNEDDPFERQFELYSKGKNHKSKIFYRSEPGIDFIAACLKNKQNESLVIFQEFCGGNGCPEDMYGVYHPIKQKILLIPKDWPKGNYKQAEKLLGYPVPSLIEDKRVFCCSNRQS